MMEQITKFGKIKDWNILFESAIKLAKNGYVVDAEFYDRSLTNQWKLKNYTYSNQLYLNGNNTPIPIGSKFYNPDLARTYKILAKKGAKWFYDGQLGYEFIQAVQNFPSLARRMSPFRILVLPTLSIIQLLR